MCAIAHGIVATRQEHLRLQTTGLAGQRRFDTIEPVIAKRHLTVGIRHVGGIAHLVVTNGDTVIRGLNVGEPRQVIVDAMNELAVGIGRVLQIVATVVGKGGGERAAVTDPVGLPVQLVVHEGGGLLPRVGKGLHIAFGVIVKVLHTIKGIGDGVQLLGHIIGKRRRLVRRIDRLLQLTIGVIGKSGPAPERVVNTGHTIHGVVGAPFNLAGGQFRLFEVALGVIAELGGRVGGAIGGTGPVKSSV